MKLLCKKPIRAVISTSADALAEKLRARLLRWACGECVVLSVARADNAVAWKDESADLLFLDLDSVRLAELTEARAGAGLIVVSRDAGHAIRSYRWHPDAFLKPDFGMRTLAEALTACERLWQRGRLCPESPYVNKTLRLTLGRVRYIEAAAHYCVFEQGSRPVRARFAVGELEGTLPNPPFVRCHRSYFVHLNEVDHMSYTALTLKDGSQLPVGRTYVQSLREALLTWKEGELYNDDRHTDL